MNEAVKKVTANIPAKLLARAQEITGTGITETLIAGLEELERSRKRSALRGLRGRVRFALDLEKSRKSTVAMRKAGVPLRLRVR